MRMNCSHCRRGKITQGGSSGSPAGRAANDPIARYGGNRRRREFFCWITRSRNLLDHAQQEEASVVGGVPIRAALLLVFRPHCGQSLQSVIPIMISEPIATATGQMKGNSSSTPTTTARTRRVLFTCAKRQPATPIGYLRLAPSSGDPIL